MTTGKEMVDRAARKLFQRDIDRAKRHLNLFNGDILRSIKMNAEYSPESFAASQGVIHYIDKLREAVKEYAETVKP